MKKLVIVGGGTAGWLAALYYQEYYKHIFNITVIESKKIGIIGVGEGATFQLINFLDSIRVPVSDLVKHAGATIKNGIKFTNWKNDGKYFYHGFRQHHELDCFYSVLANNKPTILIDTLANDESIISINYSDQLSDLCKVPFVKRQTNQNQNQNKIFDFEQYAAFSIHFNTNKFGQYLKSVGESRGIKTIDAVVYDQYLDEQGFIRKLFLETENSKLEESVDFVIDCTGFARRFVKDVYKAPWISYGEYLPVNKAVPFFVDILPTEKIPPYTEAIAMKYGWLWKIPVQDRFGCGYVFDSTLITEEQALQEAEQLFGKKLYSPRTINFTAGTFTKPWNKNCLALGLAGGFIEPLESTSIWTTVNSILAFGDRILDFENNNYTVIDDYNNLYADMNREIFEFVYLHYLTDRTDTQFWKKFHNRQKDPNQLIANLERLNSLSLFGSSIKYGNYFLVFSWLQIGLGNGLLKSNNIKHIAKLLLENNINLNNWTRDRKGKLLQDIDSLIPNSIDHRAFLEYLSDK